MTEDLVAGGSRDAELSTQAIFSPSRRRATKRRRSSMRLHSLHGIGAPTPNALMCKRCLRYPASAMCRVPHIRFQPHRSQPDLSDERPLSQAGSAASSVASSRACEGVRYLLRRRGMSYPKPEETGGVQLNTLRSRRRCGIVVLFASSTAFAAGAPQTAADSGARVFRRSCAATSYADLTHRQPCLQ